MKPIRLAVLLSGGGRTLLNLAKKIQEEKLPAEILLVISSHREAYGLMRARELGLPHTTIDYRAFGGQPRRRFSDGITEAVDGSGVDLVAMAGFVRKWKFPERYNGRVLNIHPALLPAFGGKGFYGDRVHQTVIESGVKFSGCTVHFADMEYDHGPIILQRVVPVFPDDTPKTLADRVFAEECIAYPEAIRGIAERRLEVRDGRVWIRQEEEGVSRKS